MNPVPNAFQQALRSLDEMTATERNALAAACVAFDGGTSTPLPSVLESAGGFTFYSDGTVSVSSWESYFTSQAAGRKFASPIQHNAFFSDNDALAKSLGVELPQEALDSIAYNRSVGGTPLFNGAAYSATSNGRQFDRKSVRGLPYAFSLRHPASQAESILSQWQAQSPPFVPTQLHSDWTVI